MASDATAMARQEAIRLAMSVTGMWRELYGRRYRIQHAKPN
jgi:hypothetical protein